MGDIENHQRVTCEDVTRSPEESGKIGAIGNHFPAATGTTLKGTTSPRSEALLRETRSQIAKGTYPGPPQMRRGQAICVRDRSSMAEHFQGIDTSRSR